MDEKSKAWRTFSKNSIMATILLRRKFIWVGNKSAFDKAHKNVLAHPSESNFRTSDPDKTRLVKAWFSSKMSIFEFNLIEIIYCFH